jgi:hypothetical protein
MKRLPISRRAVWLGAAAVVIVGLALAAWRLAPQLLPAAPEAPPLKSADTAIRLTESGNGVLVIYADLSGARDAADNFDKTAALVVATGEALQRGVSDDLKGVKTVRFSIRCEAINRFGQDVMAQLVTLDLPLRALKAEDYAKVRPAHALGMAQTVSLGAPGAYDAIAAWCADAARSDAGFCKRAQAA